MGGRCVERLSGTGNTQFAERWPDLYRGVDRYGSDADQIVDGEPHASRARPPRRWGVCDGACPEGFGYWVPRLFRTRHFQAQGTLGFVLVRNWPRFREGTARSVRLSAITARADEHLTSASGTWKASGIVHRSSRWGAASSIPASWNSASSVPRVTASAGPSTSLRLGRNS